MSLNELTLRQASDGLQKKEFSSEDLVRACLIVIEKKDKELHAFLSVHKDDALVEARTIDAERAKGAVLSPLAGIPLALKDNLATEGVPTTAASKMLEEYVPPYDATVVARVKAEGMVVLGKTNLDEFAHGASTEYSAFGPTKNPWNPEYVPGGSSGGSAAAVAASECIAALGSDTGGSIRQPASFCGVVGLKPSYGRVSRSGLLSMTSSTDVVGTVTKTVEDSALLLSVIAGEDSLDATTSRASVPAYHEGLKKKRKPYSIGIPKEFFAMPTGRQGEGLDADVRQAVESALKTFESLGMKTREVSLPHTKYGLPVYYILTPSEISANLARYDGIRYGYSQVTSDLPAQAGKRHETSLEDVYRETRANAFGPEVKRRIMLGTYALSSGYYDAYYKKASTVRTLIIEDFENAFTDVDLLVTPTMPHPAFRIGEKIDDPLKLYLEDIYVTGASLAGLPAISVPCGFRDLGGSKLPIGLQIIGKQFDEMTVLAAAHAYEQATRS